MAFRHFWDRQSRKVGLHLFAAQFEREERERKKEKSFSPLRLVKPAVV